jgi:cold shock CspA family protein
MKMVVDKYIPDGLYGFLTETTVGGDTATHRGEVFFHVSTFDPGAYVGDAPVPPIVGETVEVTIEEGRVVQCERLHSPEHVIGKVDWFSEEKGYGFIVADDNQYFLHRTEVLDGRLPLKGRRVSFYTTKQERTPLRACYVTVEI